MATKMNEMNQGNLSRNRKSCKLATLKGIFYGGAAGRLHCCLSDIYLKIQLK